MFLFKYFFILLHAAIVFGLDNVSSTAIVEPLLNNAARDTETEAPETSTHFPGQPPIQSSELTTSTITKLPPSSSPKAPSSTDPPPTAPPTTTKAPSTTVTAAPTSTSTEVPITTSTSTIAPSTTAAPPSDEWIVNGNGTVCIIASMAIKLDLKSDMLTPKKKSIKVPINATATGTCGVTEQTLNLMWDSNLISFHFKVNDTQKKYFLDSIAVDIKAENQTVSFSKGDIVMFETALNHSYMCSYADPVEFSHYNDTILFSFSDIKLEAFKKDSATNFSNVSACPSDTPDIVPIVVGCALTVLVIVVLIAYLVGRRRTQASGYLSM